MTVLAVWSLTTIFLIVMTLVNGLVLRILWGWFAVPVFSLPPLSIPAAIGVHLMVAYLAEDSATKKEEGSTFLLAWTMKPVLALLVGYVVHLFL